MNVITEWALQMLADLLGGFVNVFTPLLVAVADFSTAILEWEAITRSTLYVQIFATAALVLMMLYKGVMMYGAGVEDEVPLSSFVIRGATATAAIWAIPILVRQAIAVGSAMTADLMRIDLTVTINAQAVSEYQKWVTQNLLAGLTGGNLQVWQALWSWVFVVVLVVMMAVIVFQIAKRSIELALMCVAGPVFAVNYASADRSMWSAWVRNLLLLTFTQVLQVFLLRLCLYAFVNQAFLASIPDTWPASARGIGTFIIQLALLAVTIKAPRFFASIMHQGQPTGTGQVLTHAAATAVQVAAGR